MAKYVGKIFKVNNRVLKLKGSQMHYVHVQYYNPLTRKFRCRVITSLEKRVILSEDKSALNSYPYYKNEDGSYSFFEKQKYSKLRTGEIQPIIISKTKGFEMWHGYEGTRDLNIKDLKGKEQKHLSIKK